MESKEVSMERQIIESKLLATREELSKAGPIHARDLQKYIHRLEKQLRILTLCLCATMKRVFAFFKIIL